jgi:hypothetical protein
MAHIVKLFSLPFIGSLPAITFVLLFLALVVGVLLLAAFLPSMYQIEKVRVIKKPISEVMRIAGDLNFYAKWNPWQQMDSSATKTITGNPQSIGHTYSWHGKKTGVGRLTINRIDDTHIHFDLEFLKPWKSHAKDDWSFEKTGDNETKVIWRNSGDLPWPMARLMGPLIIKNLSHQFEKGLNNLKQMVEES